MTRGGVGPGREDAIKSLEQVMPATSGRGEEVDWLSLRTAWGTPFPTDYLEFMASYGAGSISDAFVVLLPVAPAHTAIDGMASETANARAMWVPGVPPSERYAGKEPVMAWGASSGADITCWLTDDRDPDKWPVAVLKRTLESPWRVYDCGMVEFLLRTIGGEFEECPLSDETLWNNAPQTFLHRSELERLRAEGLNPWTGEPDPFAGWEFD